MKAKNVHELNVHQDFDDVIASSRAAMDNIRDVYNFMREMYTNIDGIEKDNCQKIVSKLNMLRVNIAHITIDLEILREDVE